MQLRDLPGRNLNGLLWVRRKQPQFAALTQHDEFTIGHNGGTSAVNGWLRGAVGTPTLLAAPHEFAAVQLHAPKCGVGLIPATKRVEETLVQDWRIPVHFQHGPE